MDQVPILKIGQTLFVSIQIDLQDESVIRLQEDLAEELAATGAHGVIIDITAVEIVDSFIGRMLTMIGSISRLFDAETVIVGMRPAVAITLTELGLSLSGVRTALNAEKGLEILNGKVLMDELPIRSGDDVVRVRQQVRTAAAENGLSLVDQTKLVTAASELARNTLVHGGGGLARVEVVKSPNGRAGVKLHFTDEGPGIADIDLALTDGWTTGQRARARAVRRAAACRRVRAELEARRRDECRGRQVVALSRSARRPGPGRPALAAGRGSQRGRRLPRRRHRAGQPARVPRGPHRPADARGDRGGVQPAQARQPGVDAAAHRQAETAGRESRW